MLTDDKVHQISERLAGYMTTVNSKFLDIMGKRIKAIGRLSEADLHRLNRMAMAGADIEAITRELSKASGKSIREVTLILEATAKANYEFAKSLYQLKGIAQIPFEQNEALKQMVQAIAEQTTQEYINISKTTGFAVKGADGRMQYTPLAKGYQEAIDKAIISVSTGQGTVTEETKGILKDYAQSGIRTIDYESGYSRRLDTAVRHNVLEGITQVQQRSQEIIAEQVGADGWEISVHLNPAPDHQYIQGRQYNNADYEKLNNELERPISTLNCRHIAFAIILGVNDPNYTKEQLQKIIDDNNKGVTIAGKHYTMYEATQVQRRLETAIREQRDIRQMAQQADNREVATEAWHNIRRLSWQYKEFSKTASLPTRAERTR